MHSSCSSVTSWNSNIPSALNGYKIPKKKISSSLSHQIPSSSDNDFNKNEAKDSDMLPGSSHNNKSSDKKNNETSATFMSQHNQEFKKTEFEVRLNSKMFRTNPHSSVSKYGFKSKLDDESCSIIKVPDFSKGFRIPKKSPSTSSIHSQTTGSTQIKRAVKRTASNPESFSNLTLDPEQIKLIKRGQAPGYLIEAFKDPVGELRWKKEVAEYRQRKTNLPKITGKEKTMINWRKEKGDWPQGSRDREEISKQLSIDYDKVDRQIRNDPRNKVLVRRYGKRQQRDKITVQQKEELSRSIAREKPDLSGSVSREIFRLTSACPDIRRDQLTTYCRSYT
ncbi:hypothetical protein GCK72_018535 [Caenorhabditis remanei]|uniref:Uncharacterized protein n=1 Tax=Caenorhabditis remanei TaxID=31234 RepID=A0A6A5GB28_CAERE|nr:hypothetical protein GCK72_018535 [Caenorhabditis remanei]KAF1751981.1 hypothetical protein GCK72_018535 [Caenorhabditis remanei]